MLNLALDKDPNQHPVVFLKTLFLKQMVQGSVISYLEEVPVIPNFPKQYSYHVSNQVCMEKNTKLLDIMVV